MQLAVEVQDTDVSVAVGPAGLGVGWMVQPLRSQCSASVYSTPFLNQVPTAMQVRLDRQDTPFR